MIHGILPYRHAGATRPPSFDDLVVGSRTSLQESQEIDDEGSGACMTTSLSLSSGLDPRPICVMLYVAACMLRRSVFGASQTSRVSSSGPFDPAGRTAGLSASFSARIRQAKIEDATLASLIRRLLRFTGCGGNRLRAGGAAICAENSSRPRWFT